jgi:hypothetical protein
MHIDTEGAAVDLRGAQLQQVKQLMFEATGGQIFFQVIHGFQRFGSEFQILNSGLHGESPFCGKNTPSHGFRQTEERLASEGEPYIERAGKFGGATWNPCAG